MSGHDDKTDHSLQDISARKTTIAEKKPVKLYERMSYREIQQLQWRSIQNISYRLGLRIKILRYKMDLSQNELARLSRLDRSYLSGVERGKRNISIVNLAKIAMAMDLSLHDLIEDF